MQKTIFALLLALTGTHVAAELHWDGFHEVPAVAVGNGRWLTCPKGSYFGHEKGVGLVDKSACHEGQLLRTRVAAPLEKDLQGVLDLHAKPPAGTRYQAVGPLPSAIGSSSSSDAWLHIAYKIVKE